MKNRKKKFLNKINNFIINNKTIIFNSVLLFFVFLFISYFIPLTGDDWTNANFNTNNIFKIINIAWDKYFLHEGRFASRIFVVFFTNTKWLWNIVNAAMISGIYFFSMKIIKPKNIVIKTVNIFGGEKIVAIEENPTIEITTENNIPFTQIPFYTKEIIVTTEMNFKGEDMVVERKFYPYFKFGIWEFWYIPFPFMWEFINGKVLFTWGYL